jgi:glutathione S-transferase
MAPVRVWGARYSVFSRMLELALREKDHPYEWHERDVFDSAADRADQESRHPWGKVPAMEHGGIALYETRACLAYLEQPEFGAVRLEPEAPRARARAEQVFSIAASYAYPAMVWEVFVEAVGRRAEGLEPDPERVAHGLGRAERVLDAVEPLVGADGVLDGARPTLADIALGPVFAYFTCVGPARLLLAGRPALRDWWHGWRERPSMQATRSPLEDA